MKKYRIGNNVFEADNLKDAILIIRANGWSGSLKEIKAGAPAPAKTINDGDKAVKVTCGWGKSAHRWETTKGEAIAHRNTCPQHRS